MDPREVVQRLLKAEQSIKQLIASVNTQGMKLKELEARLAGGRAVEVTKFEKEERHEGPEQEEFDESADEGGY